MTVAVARGESEPAHIHVSQAPRMISLFIPGHPVPFARAGRGVGHSYTPDRQASYMTAVGFIARSAMAKAGYSLFVGPLEFQARFTFSYPESWSVKKRGASDFKWSKADLDNLIKLQSDSLEKIVFTNDAQICSIIAQKVYGETEGATITIQELRSPVRGGNGEARR
jgi:Holliday junction resolvase RusA-like endonuclease